MSHDGSPSAEQPRSHRRSGCREVVSTARESRITAAMAALSPQKPHQSSVAVATADRRLAPLRWPRPRLRDGVFTTSYAPRHRAEEEAARDRHRTLIEASLGELANRNP